MGFTSSDNTPAVTGTNTDGGDGVEGVSDSGFGVHGVAGSGVHVVAKPPGGVGVFGESSTSAGVLGQSDVAAAVAGVSDSGTGVHGTCTSGVGVWGQSQNGVGVFAQGGAMSAQIHLVPVPLGGQDPNAASVPGQPGDLLAISGWGLSVASLWFNADGGPKGWSQVQGGIPGV
jgi:hypothetical protein